MRVNVLRRYVLPLLIALPIGALLLYPQVLRCMYVRQSADFHRLAPGSETYVSRTATASQQAKLQQHVRVAHDRIHRFWGDRRGRATLIYCPIQADYEQYCAGGEGAGCSLGTPWGTSYLVLGPDGNNPDVIAHELCHDELFARLGWWRVKRQIPQWFNEGLALMVDYRFTNPAVWDKPDSLQQALSTAGEDDWVLFPQHPMLKLADLETTRDFFGGDSFHTMLAYQTAAEEVTRWLAVVGRPGVPALSNAMATGHEFSDTYRQLERAKRAARKRSK
ncbi:hypothetical protein [Spirosoma endophyticum]|uniref:Peptidase MA superfamily protein n=1 Tax=Spirosoma endophyticum TaxID=662367 RepID=A0A1I1UDN5_9BACT|nr:hypothetical protein [Spirosoma endophyticum]SFD68804.1 hypothetical protein SAMN05216167_106228 [Spirosoma endophyticum]